VSERIVRVWIEEGCISCKLCQDMAPDVFLVEDDQDCKVRTDAAARFEALADDIREAARDCPVEVIKLELQ
jgi:ferredoxin